MKYQMENQGGEVSFRCAFHDGWIMSENLHEYSELLYCKEGAGEVFINGKSIGLSAGQLVWIPPHYVHRFHCPDAKVICAVFSHDLIPLFFKAQGGRYFCASAVDVGELSGVLDTFDSLDAGDYCTVSGYLNLICSKVIGQSDFEGDHHADGALYQKVISYVAEHFREDITLSFLAARFGYNEKYLSHALHELTGTHFRQFLNLYRVEAAKKALIDQPLRSVTDIAMECGFSAVNTFHRVFKDSTEMTPFAYRKKWAR